MTSEDMKTNLAITAAHNYTAVGHGAVMTSTSVRAGLSRLFMNDGYPDSEGNPVTMAAIECIDDGQDATARIIKTARLSLESLLESYFRDRKTPSPPVHFFLGVPSTKRPGPPFGDLGLYSLVETIEKRRPCRSIHVYPRGNASFMYALKHAGDLIKKTSDAVCIVGCIDSLLSTSTLDWFEKDERLKSHTHGRHHAFIPGEAAGFLIIEGARHAISANRPILAYITGTGISPEPSPRAISSSITATGLTKACREALKDVDPSQISDIFTDLNGENTRAREWQLAQLRIFNKQNGKPKLWCPAECYGDIGAAHGAVMAAIIAYGFKHNWLENKVLMSLSDDHGSCGAIVLEHGDRDEPWVSYA